METVEQLFTKIRNDFGETSEKEKKIEQLRMIEQGVLGDYSEVITFKLVDSPRN